MTDWAPARELPGLTRISQAFLRRWPSPHPRPAISHTTYHPFFKFPLPLLRLLPLPSPTSFCALFPSLLHQVFQLFPLSSSHPFLAAIRPGRTFSAFFDPPYCYPESPRSLLPRFSVGDSCSSTHLRNSPLILISRCPRSRGLIFSPIPTLSRDLSK